MSTDRGGGPARGTSGAGDGRARARRAPSKDGLLILGVVGRAGSGKSTVARIIGAQGARLIEADVIGHQVTDTNPDVRAALIAEYGADVYRTSGTLDRARVGARVFSDPAALARLNALVHPRILAEMRRQLDSMRTRGERGTVLVDAALMLDWGFERECDAVMAVVATEEQQISRLMRTRGWSEEEARGRLAAQRTNEAFRAAADEVIENTADAASLLAATRSAFGRIVAKRGV